MEVDIRVEMIATKRIDEGREALRNMAVTQVFTHDCAVL